MRFGITIAIVGVGALATCIIAALLFMQKDGEYLNLICSDEVNGGYAMMFAFQYGGGAYFIKVDNDLFIWACRGPVKGNTVAEEDFANLDLSWRNVQIAQEDFDYLARLTKEVQLRKKSSLGDDLIVLGAWTLTVFYDSYTFREMIYEDKFSPLTEKLVELSPIRVDLTVWGGS